MSARYLVIPDTRRGHGSGHITRAARLAASLESEAELFVDYPWEEICHEPQKLLEVAERFGARVRRKTAEPSSTDDTHETPSLVIIDAQNMTRAAHAELRSLAPTVGIDLGGEARPYASYLIDTLPNLFSHSPNLFDPGLNELPARVRRSAASTSANGPSHTDPRILVSIGGEDPAGLTPRVLEKLDRSRFVADKSVDVVVGPLSHDTSRYRKRTVSSVLPSPRLKDIVGDYDIVITTFGLTAYEALAAGASVLTVAPTRYHRRLAKRAGLHSLGGPRRIGGIGSAIRRWRDISQAQERLRPRGSRSLAEVIRSIDVNGIGPCPLRGGFNYRAVARTAERTYRESTYRGLYYLERFTPMEIEYTERYFFEEYRKQYGRTYLEDFDHIRSMCERRLDEVESLRSYGRHTDYSEAKPVLVDLGCAYGPMLAGASDRGYAVQGVEWFAGAVEYCNDSLGLPAVQGDVCDRTLPDRLGLRGRVDVVTMWYVIEHLRDLDSLFETVQRFLKPGGVFAFSTPNASGAVARRDLAGFLTAGPGDHWSVWSERHVHTLLRELGFSNPKSVVTGHHPERFAPRLARTAVGMRIAGRWSTLRRLGDTFEAYACWNAP